MREFLEEFSHFIFYNNTLVKWLISVKSIFVKSSVFVLFLIELTVSSTMCVSLCCKRIYEFLVYSFLWSCFFKVCSTLLIYLVLVNDNIIINYYDSTITRLIIDFFNLLFCCTSFGCFFTFSCSFFCNFFFCHEYRKYWGGVPFKHYVILLTL